MAIYENITEFNGLPVVEYDYKDGISTAAGKAVKLMIGWDVYDEGFEGEEFIDRRIDVSSTVETVHARRGPKRGHLSCDRRLGRRGAGRRQRQGGFRPGIGRDKIASPPRRFSSGR